MMNQINFMKTPFAESSKALDEKAIFSENIADADGTSSFENVFNSVLNVGGDAQNVMESVNVGRTESGEVAASEKHSDGEGIDRSLAETSRNLGRVQINDPGMSTVKLLTQPDAETIMNNDSALMQNIIGQMEANRNAEQNRIDGEHPSNVIPMDAVPVAVKTKLDPKIYVSLMQKADQFVGSLKDQLQTSEVVPLKLLQNFEKVSELMQLTSSERKLFAQVVATAFNGAVNAQNGIERLVSLLDFSEVDTSVKNYKLYASDPKARSPKIRVDDSLGEEVTSRPAKPGADLEARGNIAKLAAGGETRSLDVRTEGENKGDNPVEGKFEAELAAKIPLHKENLETRNVKEQETSKITDHKPLDVDRLAQELGARMTSLTRNGSRGGEMRIKLKPETLGEIYMKVEVNKVGDVNLKITAGTGETKGILEAQLPQLRENLNGQNLNLNKVDIDVGSWNMNGKDHSQYAFDSKEQFKDGRYQYASQSSSSHVKEDAKGIFGRAMTPLNRYGNQFNAVA